MKVNSNGTKVRYNGSRLGNRDSYKKSNTYVTDKGVTSVSPSDGEVSYKWEHIVGVMGLCLLMAAGIVLAIQTATNPIMMGGQILGFCASTVFILILKHRLAKGHYIGPQRRLGEKLYYIGVAFESFTLLAKYFSFLVNPYLFLAGLTIPGLIVSSFQIITRDPRRRLRILREENAVMKQQLREERDLLQVKSDLIKQLGELRSKEITYERKHDIMIKEANSNSSKRQIKRVAKADYKLIVDQVKKESAVKHKSAAKQIAEARVVGESHSRKRKGPSNNPDNPNAPVCKNPKCNNPLKGNQKVACSGTCRTAVNRAVKRGELEKTW